MNTIIPVVDEDNHNWDWKSLEKVGCFAVPNSIEMKDFLRKIHDHYMRLGVDTASCSGRNKLHLDANSQIIRLFILDHNEKHPFDTGFGFDTINLLLKAKLAKLWQIICDHYRIKPILSAGADSTGIHHYPASKNALKGLKGHIDSSLLVCNLPTGPGLEVYWDKQWHDVYLKDHMIVNIGFLGHLLSGLPPCIHKVKTVNYDRSVIVFSPGFDGVFENLSVADLLRTFFECFDDLEITNEHDLGVFKNLIFNKLI